MEFLILFFYNFSTMKKLFLLAVFTLITLPLAACSNSEHKTKLSFGNLANNEVMDLSYQEIISKVDSGENMIISSYYGYVTSCQCQSIFDEILKEYISTTHYLIYSFNNEEMEVSKDKYGFMNFNYSVPSIYIVDSGKIVHSFFYNQKAYEKIFTNSDALKQRIGKYCIDPDYYYVDEQYIDNNINKEEKIGICYIRKSCPDCSYLIPNFLIPYNKNKDIKVKTWIFDLDPYYESENYQLIKEKYHLSYESNNQFGYSNGKVPTVQYYENGILKSACVYFNDVVSYSNEEDYYFISETYYTEERVSALSYLTNEYVLNNKKLQKEEVVLPYWINSYAAMIHNQIIECFYNYYFI